MDSRSIVGNVPIWMALKVFIGAGEYRIFFVPKILGSMS